MLQRDQTLKILSVVFIVGMGTPEVGLGWTRKESAVQSGLTYIGEDQGGLRARQAVPLGLSENHI